MTEMYQFITKNVTRITETMSSGREPTEKETQTFNRLKAILAEFEKMDKSDSGKKKEASEGSIFEISMRETVLNAERIWGDAVRAPVVVSMELVERAKKLCEDNPIPSYYLIFFLFFFFPSLSFLFSSFFLSFFLSFF